MLVKIVLRSIVVDRIGVGLRAGSRRHAEEARLGVDGLEPAVGADFIQPMSSPTVSTFQPGLVETSIARFVFPQAVGKAPVMYLTSSWGVVSLRISMCSASHPSSRAITEAIRSAKHFLPSSALPP